jgi:hypothetical protein
MLSPMLTLNITHEIEKTHVHCSVCGYHMIKVPHFTPDTFDKKTGAIKRGVLKRLTWECPKYQYDTDHDSVRL